MGIGIWLVFGGIFGLFLAIVMTAIFYSQAGDGSEPKPVSPYRGPFRVRGRIYLFSWRK